MSLQYSFDVEGTTAADVMAQARKVADAYWGTVNYSITLATAQPVVLSAAGVPGIVQASIHTEAKPSELARFVVDVSKFKLRTTSWGETFLACPLCDEELKAPLDLTLIELTSTARSHLTFCPKGSNHA